MTWEALIVSEHAKVFVGMKICIVCPCLHLFSLVHLFIWVCVCVCVFHLKMSVWTRMFTPFICVRASLYVHIVSDIVEQSGLIDAHIQLIYYMMLCERTWRNMCLCLCVWVGWQMWLCSLIIMLNVNISLPGWGKCYNLQKRWWVLQS